MLPYFLHWMKYITFKVKAGDTEMRKQALPQHLRVSLSNTAKFLSNKQKKKLKKAHHLKMLDAIIPGSILLLCMLKKLFCYLICTKIGYSRMVYVQVPVSCISINHSVSILVKDSVWHLEAAVGIGPYHMKIIGLSWKEIEIHIERNWYFWIAAVFYVQMCH